MDETEKYNFIPLPEPIPITEQEWPEGILPLVHTRTMTFNHENYIRDCIDGILMQKTTFPVQVLIHDDASTDRTADIVREYEVKYPKLIKAYYQKENSYSQPDKLERREEFWSMRIGKYEATCEGDDYWTDPYKLQKQVDFLESHPDYGLVHTELDQFHILKNKYMKNHWKTNGVVNQAGDIYEDLMTGNKSMIYACTVCLRSDIVNNSAIQKEINARKLGRDSSNFLLIAIQSKIGYLPEATAVRNILPFSATQGRDFSYKLNFIRKSLEIFEFFQSKRPIPESKVKIFYKKHYLNIMDLCYTFKHNNELFDESYEKYKKIEPVSFAIKVKKIGMRNAFFYFMSRVLLKIIKLV